MAKVSPCKGCEKRVELCHASCEPYQKWKQEKNEAKKQIYEYEAYKSYVHDSVRTMGSRKGKNPALKMHKK